MEENLNNENEVVLDDEEIEVNQNDAEEVDNDSTNNSEVKTYTEEEVEEIKANLKKEYDDNSQKLFNNRWAREKEKINKENAPLLQMEEVLKKQLGATDRNDLVKKLGDFYEVDISNNPAHLSDRDERVLAKADAEDIKALGEAEMVLEANRIASIPVDKRTIRDNVIFESLARELTENKNRNLLKEKGYDLAILDDNEFKNFRKKLNYETSITEAVEMYNLLNNAKNAKTKPTKPASAGSTKSNVTQNQIKDFYTYEESLAFTKADFDKNPELFEVVQRSMSKW